MPSKEARLSFFEVFKIISLALDFNFAQLYKESLDFKNFFAAQRLFGFFVTNLFFALIFSFAFPSLEASKGNFRYHKKFIYLVLFS